MAGPEPGPETWSREELGRGRHLWSSRDRTTERTSGAQTAPCEAHALGDRPQAGPSIFPVMPSQAFLLLPQLEQTQKRPRPEEEKACARPLPSLLLPPHPFPVALPGCRPECSRHLVAGLGPHLEQPPEQGHRAAGPVQVEVAQEATAQEGELLGQRGAAGQRSGARLGGSGRPAAWQPSSTPVSVKRGGGFSSFSLTRVLESCQSSLWTNTFVEPRMQAAGRAKLLSSESLAPREHISQCFKHAVLPTGQRGTEGLTRLTGGSEAAQGRIGSHSHSLGPHRWGQSYHRAHVGQRPDSDYTALFCLGCFSETKGSPEKMGK